MAKSSRIRIVTAACRVRFGSPRRSAAAGDHPAAEGDAFVDRVVRAHAEKHVAETFAEVTARQTILEASTGLQSDRMAERILYFDESGFTGYNLLDPHQPIFAVVSSSIFEDHAQEILNVSFPSYRVIEFKFFEHLGLDA